jgi:hypothetical protein
MGSGFFLQLIILFFCNLATDSTLLVLSKLSFAVLVRVDFRLQQGALSAKCRSIASKKQRS